MIKHTVTTLFMVPPFKFPKEWIAEWETTCNFINAYSYESVMNRGYEDCIYLLFKPEDPNYFYSFVEKEYERSPQIVEDESVGEFIILTYKLFEEWKNDYDLIRNGKYSWTSKRFQDMFPKVKKIIKNGLHRDEVTLQKLIFAKADNIKELIEKELDIEIPEGQEVWSTFNTKRETLTFDVLEANKN